MHSADFQQWKSYSPLLYNYLSCIEVPGFESISSAKFSKQEIKSSSFKFEEYKVIISGKSEAQNGMFSINQVFIPLPNVLDDQRIKHAINRTCQLNFQTQITIFEECTVRGLHSTSSQSFMAMCEKNNPQILVYQLDSLQKMKEKVIINPRLTFKGHLHPITALKSRNDQILSGNKNGEIKIFSLNNNSKQQATIAYNYHRKEITDCCWLSAEGTTDKFISSSLDGIIYIWDKRSPLPGNKIESKQTQVYCLQFIKDFCFLSGGMNGIIKLFDIRMGCNKFFTYSEHTTSVKRICKIQQKEFNVEKSNEINFLSGAQNGEILIWNQQPQFLHLAHDNEIVDISHERNTELFMSVEKDKPSLNLWKPSIFNYQ